MKFRTQTVARQLVVTLLALLALTEGVRSAAQTQATGQTPASSRSVLLKEGTEIKLKLHDKISSKTALEGDVVNLILDQGRESRVHHGCKGWVLRCCDRLSRREARNAGQTRRSWPEIGVPEG